MHPVKTDQTAHMLLRLKDTDERFCCYFYFKSQQLFHAGKMHLSYFKPFKKWELLLKEGIYSQKEQILTLNVDPLTREVNISMSELFPLKVYPFS